MFVKRFVVFGAAMAAATAFALGAASVARAQSVDFTLEEQHYDAPKNGGIRRWQLASAAPSVDLLAKPASDARVVDTQDNGSVLSNIGCRFEDDVRWCQVRALHGGPRGFVPASVLKPAAGPDGVVALGVNDSRRKAKKRKYDAKAMAPCAQERGQALAPCPVSVSRSDGGDATVRVTFPNEFVRRLFFMHGEFISGSATMSGVGTDTDWRVEDGVHFIRVDDQQFELPNAFVFGE